MNAEEPASIDLAREPDFRLGVLLVRPSRREIGEGEARELLEPRVMQALVALARLADEVVSRDALIASCWDGRIVGDDAINGCVAKVRRAGATHRAFAIETIPRVGYRLKPQTAPEAPEVLLAVLPFDNLSDDPQLGYFSDGVSEEILHTLAQRADLKVIGRSSSFQLRGPDKAAGNVARQVGATHVLDGAVRRSGDRTRISMQLIDAATETTVWADRFERSLADIFALQDEIARAVAQAMRIALAPAVRSGSVDPIAYDLYLRGNSAPPDMESAYRAQVAQLEEATQRAPTFADAWASLGYLLASRAYFLGGIEATPLRAQACAAARRALELDPRCAMAAAAMARATPAYEAVGEHEAWLSRAITWAPNNPTVGRLYGRLLAATGRNREALSVIRRAHRLDPLDLHIRTMLGRSLIENGEFAEAAEVLEGARNSWGEFQLLPMWAVIGLAALGEIERARQILAEYDIGPYRRDVTALIELHYGRAPDAGARAMAGLRAQFAKSGRVTIDLLTSAAELGDLDEVFEIASRAQVGPPPDLPSPSGGANTNLAILFTQGMPRIRREPRFVELCHRLGLVDHWLATERWPDCVVETAPYYDFQAECRRAAEARRQAV